MSVDSGLASGWYRHWAKMLYGGYFSQRSCAALKACRRLDDYSIIYPGVVMMVFK